MGPAQPNRHRTVLHVYSTVAREHGASSERSFVTVSITLLAAGESTRMGTQKALLPWNGSATLLEYHLDQAQPLKGVTEIIVVTGHDPERINEIVTRRGENLPHTTYHARARVRTAHNPNYATGKVSSIKAGLAILNKNTDTVMLLAVDQPRSAPILRALIECHTAGSSNITVPTRSGRRGHPVLFSRTLLPELEAITEDTLGIRAVLHAHADGTTEIEIDDDAIFLDLNSPADVPAQPTPEATPT